MAATIVTPSYSGCRVNPSPQKRGPVNYHAGRWSHYPSRKGELRARLERLPERQERLLLRRAKKGGLSGLVLAPHDVGGGFHDDAATGPRHGAP